MKKILTLILICSTLISKADYWTQKANFPGACRNMPFCFSIGNKGYLGCGRDSTLQLVNEFWEYDQSNNSWTQLSNFPGASIYGSATFTVINKGYVVCGSGPFNFYMNVWEYEPVSNNWTQKAIFGGGDRFYPVGFAIGNLGYVGTGGNNNGVLFNDLWQYNPITNQWIQKNNLPGDLRVEAIGFSIDSKGYIGTGTKTTITNPLLDDFWEYDPLADSWTQKANFPPGGRADAIAFSIGNKGYIGIGDQSFSGPFLDDFWEYDPVTNLWTQKLNFPGMERDEAAFFSINCKGYIGIGGEDNSPSYDDFWEYTPDSACTTGIEEHSSANLEFTISPNPANEFIIINYPLIGKEIINLIITDLNGKNVFKSQLIQSTILINDFPKGIYFVELSDGKQKAVKKFVKE